MPKQKREKRKRYEKVVEHGDEESKGFSMLCVGILLLFNFVASCFVLSYHTIPEGTITFILVGVGMAINGAFGVILFVFGISKLTDERKVYWEEVK